MNIPLNKYYHWGDVAYLGYTMDGVVYEKIGFDYIKRTTLTIVDGRIFDTEYNIFVEEY